MQPGEVAADVRGGRLFGLFENLVRYGEPLVLWLRLPEGPLRPARATSSVAGFFYFRLRKPLEAGPHAPFFNAVTRLRFRDSRAE